METVDIKLMHKLQSKIPQKTKYFTVGYIKTFYKQTSKIKNIPMDIINIITMYYYSFISLVFDRKKCSKYLEFIDNKHVKIKNKDWVYSTCLIDALITDKMCDRYEIYFKVRCSLNGMNFRFGYVVSSDCIKNWNHGLGHKDNKNYSIGIYVGEYKYFKLFGKGNCGQSLDYKSSPKFCDGDTFGLEFNFNFNHIIIYHNYIKTEIISLNGDKQIIPAFSLIRKGSEPLYANQSIQLIKHSLH